LPVIAFWKAKLICCGMRFTLWMRSAYLTQPLKIAIWSIS